MAIPKYYEMYKSFLSALSDGKEHHFSDVKEQVIKDFDLSESDISELLPSGKQSVFSNRIGWCRTYLKKARLIDSPSRAHFVITSEGLDVLNNEDEISDDTLMRFKSFREFIKGDRKGTSDDTQHGEAPQETLERVHAELNKALADDILNKLLENSPKFFESTVVSLMEQLGYGDGKPTQLSRDGGIDGVVYQDKLGFDVIYIQAKRYDRDKTIGRPDLQKFAGALPDKNGKGVFITTAKFSSDARKYADDKHIILIDGKKLAELMIEYNLGVSLEIKYEVKRIDNDFFEEEP